jgi:hypothetical protein
MYFLLGGLLDRLVYVPYGLAAVLALRDVRHLPQDPAEPAEARSCLGLTQKLRRC